MTNHCLTRQPARGAAPERNRHGAAWDGSAAPKKTAGTGLVMRRFAGMRGGLPKTVRRSSSQKKRMALLGRAERLGRHGFGEAKIRRLCVRSSPQKTCERCNDLQALTKSVLSGSSLRTRGMRAPASSVLKLRGEKLQKTQEGVKPSPTKIWNLVPHYDLPPQMGFAPHKELELMALVIATFNSAWHFRTAAEVHVENAHGHQHSDANLTSQVVKAPLTASGKLSPLPMPMTRFLIDDVCEGKGRNQLGSVHRARSHPPREHYNARDTSHAGKVSPYAQESWEGSAILLAPLDCRPATGRQHSFKQG